MFQIESELIEILNYYSFVRQYMTHNPQYHRTGGLDEDICLDTKISSIYDSVLKQKHMEYNYNHVRPFGNVDDTL